MNCAARVVPHFRDKANRTALWTAGGGALSFAEFERLSAGAQAAGRTAGLVAGDAVLLLDAPGPRLFASVIGLLGLGVSVVFVEPWMPVAHVEHVLAMVSPRAFIGGTLAMLWGLRVRAIRRIPRWLHIRGVGQRPSQGARYVADDVDPQSAAIITFTSGTTGKPKGIVRTHRYMWDVQDILTEYGKRDPFDAPDLGVFPNVALMHIATGRGAVLVPPNWSARALRRIDQLPAALQPQTVSCGPAFLLHLMRASGSDTLMRSLKSIYVGGAQTDCWILEQAIRRWPTANHTHIYGGTEAEPVAHGDAREAVRKSRARGRFQVLHVGRPIPELATRSEPDGMWVSGPNVVPRYLGDDSDNQALKRVDADGRLWHNMGDRIHTDAEGWWYGGRASQPADEFELEQRIYAALETSRCFVRRDPDGRLFLYGERLDNRRAALKQFPEVVAIREARIVRDRRHRARIDRRATLAKAGYGD